MSHDFSLDEEIENSQRELASLMLRIRALEEKLNRLFARRYGRDKS